VLTQLRYGESTPQWDQALQLADNLAWSGTVRPLEADRARLKSLLPSIAQQLRQGLSMVAYNDSDITTVLGELSKCYQALFTARPLAAPIDPNVTPSAAPAPPVETKAALPVSAQVADFVDDVVETERQEQAEANALAEEEDQHTEIVKRSKVGAWYEFQTEHGLERAKLSWISPISGKYLFVNRKGLKVADTTLYQLAAQLREGKAQALENVPLFERAMDAIVEKLKNTQGEEGEAEDGKAE
jgi:hypothetical protein